jgi:hypothetical protein
MSFSAPGFLPNILQFKASALCCPLSLPLQGFITCRFSAAHVLNLSKISFFVNPPGRCPVKFFSFLSPRCSFASPTAALSYLSLPTAVGSALFARGDVG